MLRKISSLTLVVALSVSCATVRLEYRTDLELDNGEEAQATYARSYDTSGHMIACIVTGVIYGGWCWVYAFMPFGSQHRAISEDAEGFIKAEVGQDVKTSRTRIIKRGYNNMPLEKEIVYFDDEDEENEENEQQAEDSQVSKEKKRKAAKEEKSRQHAKDSVREARWKEYQQSVRQFQNGTFEHYGAVEAHFSGLGLLYGTSLSENMHFNLNYFKSNPVQFFASNEPIHLTDIEATLRLHLNSLYFRFGAGHRTVSFEGGDDDWVRFGGDKVHVLGEVSTIGGVGAIGVDVTDGGFFYGIEFVRFYSPWSKISSDLTFTNNDSTSEIERRRFEDKAASEDSGDILKVKIGFIIQ